MMLVIMMMMIIKLKLSLTVLLMPAITFMNVTTTRRVAKRFMTLKLIIKLKLSLTVLLMPAITFMNVTTARRVAKMFMRLNVTLLMVSAGPNLNVTTMTIPRIAKESFVDHERRVSVFGQAWGGGVYGAGLHGDLFVGAAVGRFERDNFGGWG